MLLVKCPGCGKEISNSANRCPSCGKPRAISKCPNCKSTNVDKLFGHGFILDILERMSQGDNVSKTYECKDCKYKW